MPPESKEPCSMFLSPNGKIFKTIDEVTIYAKILDEEKMLKKKRKKEKNMIKLKLDKGEDSSSQSKDVKAKKQKLDTSDAMPSQSKEAKENKLDTSDAKPSQSASLSMGKLKCVECDDSFFNLSRLEKHFKDVHLEASQLPSSMECCSICDRRLVEMLN